MRICSAACGAPASRELGLLDGHGITRRSCLGGLGGLGASLGAGMGPGLSACSRSDSKLIRFWAMGREAEVASELLAGFKLENPGVRVQIESLPWSAAHEKLLTAFAGDATPDVAQMGNSWLAEMAAIGALEPLQPWLAATPSVDTADIFPGIWQSNQIEGRAVGLPWYVDTRLLFVRRDLLAQVGFEQTPSDWSEWRRCLAALKAAGMASPLLLPVNEFEPLLALALQQGEALLRDGGRRGNFSGPGFRKALTFYLQMFERGYAPGLTNNQVANVVQEFGRGSFAFYISGPWSIGEFKRRLPAELQDQWGTAALPGPVAGQGHGSSVAGGASLVMFKRSNVKPLAWKLIEYLARPAMQLDFYRLTGNLPPRRSSWQLPLADGSSLSEDRHAKAFATQLDRVVAAPAVPEWERIAQEMQLFAARAAFQGISIDVTVRGLDQRVDEMLEKRRWMLDRAR
jgi:multiple sugar transport system substrate-binding protein